MGAVVALQLALHASTVTTRTAKGTRVSRGSQLNVVVVEGVQYWLSGPAWWGQGQQQHACQHPQQELPAAGTIFLCTIVSALWLRPTSSMHTVCPCLHEARSGSATLMAASCCTGVVRRQALHIC